MKAGWEVRPLGEICDIAPKKALAKQTISDAQLVSFVPMDHLGELKSDFSPMEDRELASVYKGYTYFADGDVIVAKITPCFENGKMGVAKGMTNGVGFGSSEFVPIRGQGKTVPEYLFYYLLRDEFREIGARVMSGAVGHKRVPKDYLESLPIPLPPLEEQQRIVAILDDAFEGLARARENAEVNLKNARELFEAFVGTYFDNERAREAGYRVSPLSKVAKLSYGFTEKAVFEPVGPKFLRITDIQDGYVNWDTVPHCKIDADTKPKYQLERGDIVFARTGATTGKSYLIEDVADAVYASYLIRLQTLGTELDARYLAFYFQSAQYWTDVNAGIEGAAQGGFNASKLGAMVIPIPPLEVQNEVVEMLNAQVEINRSLRTHYRTKLQDFDDLRQSLLQKAFAGELT